MGKCIKILILEDNEVWANLLVEALENEGFIVYYAKTIKLAKHYIDKGVDIALVDIMLDGDVGGDAAQDGGFAHHGVVFGGGDFGADRALDDGADFGHDIEDLAAGLGDQGRVGGDAVQQAGGGEGFDLGRVGGVDEEFHGGLPDGGRCRRV